MKIIKCPYAGPDIMNKGQWAKVPGQKSILVKEECQGCRETFTKHYKKQFYCKKCTEQYNKQRSLTMGRKKLPDSRDIKKTIRFSDAEYAQLEKAFEESYVGLKNISEFIRYLVLKADELIAKTEETKEKQDGAVINKDNT